MSASGNGRFLQMAMSIGTKKHPFWLVFFDPWSIGMADCHWLTSNDSMEIRTHPPDPYPLVNVFMAMENHHFQWENQLQMAIFNSYVSLTEGSWHRKPGFWGPFPRDSWVDHPLAGSVSPIPWDSYVHREAQQLTIVFLSNLGNLAEKLENPV